MIKLLLAASLFTVTERLFWPVGAFDVVADGEGVACATKEMFSMSTTYTLDDATSKRLASATSRLCSWGTIADVVDGEGNPLGTIEENMWRIFPWGEYKILSPENKAVLIAQMDVMGMEFKLFEPDAPDQILATIERPFLRIFRDTWTVNIPDNSPISSKIDPLFLILLAVYQTDKDNRARFWQEFQDGFRLELEDFDTRRL